MTFTIALIGWIFSLCLHEFSHALVAYNGGDYTVREKGYLSFNPLKYTHPIFSLVLPLLFLFLGGIGVPGGAVYIETWRIRSRSPPVIANAIRKPRRPGRHVVTSSASPRAASVGRPIRIDGVMGGQVRGGQVRGFVILAR